MGSDFAGRHNQVCSSDVDRFDPLTLDDFLHLHVHGGRGHRGPKRDGNPHYGLA